MVQKKVKSKSVEITISEIRKISSFEIDFREYGIVSLKREDVHFKNSLSIGLDGSKEIISNRLKLTAVYMKSKEEKQIFGVEAIFIYKIKKFEKHFTKNEDNTYRIPNEFMANLLGISISGIRGMLAGLTTVPEYSKFIMPPIYTNQMLNDYMESMKLSKSG